MPLPVAKDGQKRRGTPDVAALASAVPGYRIILGGKTQKMRGTSGAAPLCAGIVAMHRGRRESGAWGRTRPSLLCTLALPRDHAGKQSPDGVGFDAGPVWNACTGLGVPTGAHG